MRKNILKYDDVMNDQRKVVFEQRREMMASESLEQQVAEMREGVVDDIVARSIPRDAYPEQWDVAAMQEAVAGAFAIAPPLKEWQQEEGITDEEMTERLQKAANEAYAARVDKNGVELMRYVEKQVVLEALDHLWREHLVTLDHLRQVIGWRGMAQVDPLNEYKREAFQLFDELIAQLRGVTTGRLNHVEIVQEQPPEGQMIPPLQAASFEPLNGHGNGHHDELAQLIGRLGSPDEVLPHNGATVLGGDTETMPARAGEVRTDDPTTWGRVGRNALCPCGSGKKYKHCHGALNV